MTAIPEAYNVSCYFRLRNKGLTNFLQLHGAGIGGAAKGLHGIVAPRAESNAL